MVLEMGLPRLQYLISEEVSCDVIIKETLHMTQMEMDVIGSYIKLSRDGNVIGADLEFKTTRDHIDGMGYILKEIYDLKLELMKDDEAEAYHLANYESHFEEFYQISYWEYRTYVQTMDPDNADEWDNPEPNKRCVAFARDLRRAQAEAERDITMPLVDAARAGDSVSARFLLERRFGENWRRR